MSCRGSKDVIIHPSIRSKPTEYRLSISFRKLISQQSPPRMGNTSAQVTTKPEKNIFGSGEKFFGFCNTFLIAETSIHLGYHRSAVKSRSNTVTIAISLFLIFPLRASCFPGNSRSRVNTCVTFSHPTSRSSVISTAPPFSRSFLCFSVNVVAES